MDRKTQTFFHDARVSVAESTRGQRYIQMTLRSGYQHFQCDVVHVNRRGLRKCERIARELGIPLFITDGARTALESGSDHRRRSRRR